MIIFSGKNSRADEGLIICKLNIFEFFTLQNMLKCGCLNGYIDFGILHSFVRLCYSSIRGRPSRIIGQVMVFCSHTTLLDVLLCNTVLCHVMLFYIISSSIVLFYYLCITPYIKSKFSFLYGGEYWLRPSRPMRLINTS
jgi:hypothetical protein